MNTLLMMSTSFPAVGFDFALPSKRSLFIPQFVNTTFDIRTFIHRYVVMPLVNFPRMLRKIRGFLGSHVASHWHQRCSRIHCRLRLAWI